MASEGSIAPLLHNGWLRRASLEEPLFQLANGFIELAPHIRMEDDFSHQSDRNSIRQFTGCNASPEQIELRGQPFHRAIARLPRETLAMCSGIERHYRSLQTIPRGPPGPGPRSFQADSLLQQNRPDGFGIEEPAADSRIFSGWHPIQQSVGYPVVFEQAGINRRGSEQGLRDLPAIDREEGVFRQTQEDILVNALLIQTRNEHFHCLPQQQVPGAPSASARGESHW